MNFTVNTSFILKDKCIILLQTLTDEMPQPVNGMKIKWNDSIWIISNVVIYPKKWLGDAKPSSRFHVEIDNSNGPFPKDGDIVELVL